MKNLHKTSSGLSDLCLANSFPFLGPLKTPSLPTLRGEITLNQQQLLDILWRLAAVDLAKRGRSVVSQSLRGIGLIQELGDFV